MRKRKQIFVTEVDRDRLLKLLERPPVPDEEAYRESLRDELARAVVVPPDRIPRDIVTMNSVVSVVETETGEEDTFTLVFPNDADVESGKISVLAPLGTAMLGYRAGDVFEWSVPSGKTRWRIESVLYQPEAAGDINL